MTDLYFFIVAGPTGAGKSSLPSKIINELDLQINAGNITHSVIDNIVEQHDHYKNDIKRYVVDKCNRIELCDTLKQSLKSPTTSDYAFFSDAYMKTRKGIDCHTGKPTEDRSLNCDGMNDKIMADAMVRGKHIVFETVGEYYPDWIFKLDNIKKYKIVMAWSVVDLADLMRRNKSRALDGMNEFIDNNEKAPRLPDVSLEPYNKRLRDIQDTFMNILNKSNEHNVRFLLIDNRTRDPDNVILYDSHKDSTEHGIRTIELYGSVSDFTVGLVRNYTSVMIICILLIIVSCVLIIGDATRIGVSIAVVVMLGITGYVCYTKWVFS